jgi:non-heme chloroperoxidase
MPQSRVPVVFIHGLWVHATAWEPWLVRFQEAGYDAVAPTWPGESATVAQTRANSEALGNVGIAAVTDHFAQIISGLAETAVVVGHSMGGLVAQRLLASGHARAAVAIGPAQFRGILRIPRAQLAWALPILGNPTLLRRTWAHSPDSLHQHFANAVSREESDEFFERLIVPAPTRPLFEAGVANVMPGTPATVDTTTTRGPLLLVAAGLDRTVPASLVRAAFARQRRNSGPTELVEYPGRGHSLTIDHGWSEVADRVLDFLGHHVSPAGEPRV